MNEIRPLNVLVSAFNFNPVRGSECSVGWDYVRAIASRHKVWVITRRIEKEEIEQYLLQHPDAMPNVTVHYVRERFRNIDSSFGLLTNYLRYMYWHWDAFKTGRSLNAQINFDLIHQLTGTGFREPGHLWKLGKPFVWGPIGGLQFFPLQLLNAVPFRSRLFFVLKNLSTVWAMYIARRPRRAAAAAQAILAGSSNVADKVRTLWGRNATVSCQVSAPVLEPRQPVRRGSGEPLRIIWSGSCEPRKALNIVLLALVQLKLSPIDWRLTVVGDGPLQGNWKALAGRLGLGERCDFLGMVSRAEVLSVMASGHCFVLSSLYEGTPTVVVEALANGLPVICLDHFGMKDAVNAECGIKIPPNRLDQVVRDFSKAIKALGQDEELRYAMSVAAQKASQRLSWKHKEDIINDVYSRILPAVSLGSVGGVEVTHTS
jgi:glycosyltransferase involved in cell wall biosynthesis